jgi:putative hydrolase of the HAD superfamily
MIKNIIFDLSEVIISGYIGLEYIIEQEKGIPAKDFLKRKNETIDFFLDTMRGNYSEEEYWSYLLNGTGWNIDVQDLKNMIRRFMNVPLDGTASIVKELKDKYTLILLSDHVKEWMNFILENNDIIPLFDYKYFSYINKKIKQDEGVFEFVLNDLNIRADETLFIDDFEGNVKRAQEIGIEGIVFKDANQLRQDLIKMNIL